MTPGKLKAREGVKQYNAATTRNPLLIPTSERRTERYERRFEREIAEHIENSEPS